MGVDGVALGQLAQHAAAQQRAHQLRPALAELVDQRRDRDVLPARDRVRPAVAQHPPQAVRDRVLGRDREDVGRRALQHRDVGRLVGQRRHERHRGRAAADHQHALAYVVKVLGPELRVHELALEALEIRPVRPVPLVVAVVAAAHVQEVAGDIGTALDRDRPARVGGRPRGARHAVAEAHPLVDPRLARGVAHVVEDRRAVGDRLRRRPRPEPVARASACPSPTARPGSGTGPTCRRSRRAPRRSRTSCAADAPAGDARRRPRTGPRRRSGHRCAHWSLHPSMRAGLQLHRHPRQRRAPVLQRGGRGEAVAGAGDRHLPAQRPLGERVGEALLGSGAVGADAVPARAARRYLRREPTDDIVSATSAKSTTWASSCSVIADRSIVRSPSRRPRFRRTSKRPGASTRARPAQNESGAASGATCVRPRIWSSSTRASGRACAMAARTHARSASGKSGENVSSCEAPVPPPRPLAARCRRSRCPRHTAPRSTATASFPSSHQRRVHAGIHHWSDG